MIATGSVQHSLGLYLLQCDAVGPVLGLGLVIIGPLVSFEYRETLGWNQIALRGQPLRGSVPDHCWYSAAVIAYLSLR